MIESWKREAQAPHHAGKYRQPMLVLRAEMELVVADEFRDGNVGAHTELPEVARPEARQIPARRKKIAQFRLSDFWRCCRASRVESDGSVCCCHCSTAGLVSFDLRADMTRAQASSAFAVFPAPFWQSASSTSCMR